MKFKSESFFLQPLRAKLIQPHTQIKPILYGVD